MLVIALAKWLSRKAIFPTNNGVNTRPKIINANHLFDIICGLSQITLFISYIRNITFFRFEHREKHIQLYSSTTKFIMHCFVIDLCDKINCFALSELFAALFGNYLLFSVIWNTISHINNLMRNQHIKKLAERIMNQSITIFSHLWINWLDLAYCCFFCKTCKNLWKKYSFFPYKKTLI